MRSFMVVAVKVVGQSSLQLHHRVILSEIDVPSIGAAPEPFAKNIFQGAAVTVHDDLRCWPLERGSIDSRRKRNVPLQRWCKAVGTHQPSEII